MNGIHGEWMRAYGGSISHHWLSLGDGVGNGSLTACGKRGMLPLIQFHVRSGKRRCARCEKALAKKMVANAAHQLAQDKAAIKELASDFLKGS